MANTHNLIQSTVLSTTTASVSFSSITQSYRDLVLYVVARNDTADTNVNLNVRVNNDSGSNYGVVQLSFYGTGINQNEGINNTSWGQALWGAGTTMTANMFSTNTMYFPNYTNTSNKQISAFAGMSSSSVRSYVLDTANDYRGTSAITSISITPYSGNFVSGSSFYLYGLASE